MIKTVFTSTVNTFAWKDVTDPTRIELDDLAGMFRLPQSTILHWLDPTQQPRYQKILDNLFVVLRPFDETCSPTVTSVNEMTKRFAIFTGVGYLITLHPHEENYLTYIKEKWKVKKDKEDTDLLFCLLDILFHIVQTYEKPLTDVQLKLEQYEGRIFNNQGVTTIIKELYFLKRRGTVIQKMLRSLLDIVRRLTVQQQHIAVYADLKEYTEELLYDAERELDGCTNLLNLNLALSSNRTNDVMKVLTIFSAFFLPLSFLVGLWGMNFKSMPEYTMPYGYGMAIIIMAGITIFIYGWFKSKDWL